jgi:hypothetical protein
VDLWTLVVMYELVDVIYMCYVSAACDIYIYIYIYIYIFVCVFVNVERKK